MFRLYTLFLFSVVAIAPVLTGGCSISVPPSERSAAMEPLDVGAPGPDALSGELMLKDDGLWAFIDEEDEEPETLKEGQLVVFRPAGVDRSSHLFAVVAGRPWGAVFQRLGGGSLSTPIGSGRLEVLDSKRALDDLGVCVGGGTRGDTCDLADEKHRALRFYRIDDDLRVRVDADIDAPRLPVATEGLLHDRRGVADAGLDAGRWIGVPARTRAGHLPHARVGVGPGCPSLDTDAGLQDIEVIDLESAPEQDHPVEIEAAAIEHGVDAFLTCSKNSTTLAVSGLYRALMSVPGTSIEGIALGSMRPTTVATDSDVVRRDLARLGAAAATDAPLVADYYLERIVAALDDAPPRDEFSLAWMQLPTVAERTDYALRLGSAAVGQAWNQQHKTAYLIGRGWAEASLGNPSETSKAYKRLSTLGDRAETEKSWLTWSRLRSALRDGQTRRARVILDQYIDDDRYRWADAALQLVEWDGQSWGAEHTPISGALEEAEGSRCSSDECLPDVYGANFAHLVELWSDRDAAQLARRLSTTGYSAVRPGFQAAAIERVDSSPEGRVAALSAAMALVETDDLPDHYARLLEAIGDEARRTDGCIEVPDGEAIARRLAQRRSAERHTAQIDQTRWILADALPAACDSARALVESLTRGFETFGEAAGDIEPVVAARLGTFDADDRADFAARMADLTAEYERGDLCRRWNLAYAASMAAAARFDEAERRMTTATNCGDPTAPSYEREQKVIRAYIRFEKTGGAPFESAGEVGSALARLTKRDSAQDGSKSCLGLGTLDYDLASVLDEEIATLMVSVPSPSGEALELKTSSHRVNRARAAFDTARRNLAQGRPAPAAEALRQARRDFEALGHRVGLERVALLERVVFDGDLDDDWESADTDRSSLTEDGRLELPDDPSVSPESDWAKLLRAGLARPLLENLRKRDAPGSEETTRAEIAAALVVGGAEEARKIVRSREQRAGPSLLCGGVDAEND
ncbi:MAG: hypothetical protein ACOCV2_03075 [Persicimonas sp.]